MPIIAGNIKFKIIAMEADPEAEVAVGPITEVREDVMALLIDITAVLDADEDLVDDEPLELDGAPLAASGVDDARAAQAVEFLSLLPTKDPMFATTAWLSRRVTVALPSLPILTVLTVLSTLVAVPSPLCS